MKNESKNKQLEAAAEQWVNLVFAHIEAKKQQELIKSKNRRKETQD